MHIIAAWWILLKWIDNGEKNVEVWSKTTIAYTHTHIHKKVWGDNERDKGVSEKEAQKHNDQEQEMWDTGRKTNT